MRFPLAPARSSSMAARDSARLRLGAALVGAVFLFKPGAAGAADCPVTHEQLVKALKAGVKAAGGPKNGGFQKPEMGGGRGPRRPRLPGGVSGGKPRPP